MENRINTKWIMSTSAMVMGIVGIVLSFMPQEILNYLGSTNATGIEVVILQVMGALYFAFAMTNWTAKANLIGGIYGRPIAIGNLCHFTMAALALIKVFFRTHQTILLVPVAVYVIFAIAYAWIFFTHPLKDLPKTVN